MGRSTGGSWDRTCAQCLEILQVTCRCPEVPSSSGSFTTAKKQKKTLRTLQKEAVQVLGLQRELSVSPLTLLYADKRFVPQRGT